MIFDNNFFDDNELNENGVMKSLKEGTKVESEHSDLVKKIRKDIEKDGKLNLTDKQIYAIIAKIHIKEDKDYYPKLKKYIEGENK